MSGRDAMGDALVGCTGFVGCTLLRQRRFDSWYRSTTIGDASGCRFGTVVCAGAPAQKWVANREPEADAANIDRLMQSLESFACDRFVLISTVDVFSVPVGVDESSDVANADLQPYGLHRLRLEQFVTRRFPRHLVVRLPGLVGPGLRKNVLYDLHHGHDLAALDARAVFQFYPMVNLWADIEVALARGLRLVHLTSEPIGVADVARHGFGIDIDRRQAGRPVMYDMRSRHADSYGGAGGYQYTRKEVVTAIRSYAQSEPRNS